MFAIARADDKASFYFYNHGWKYDIGGLEEIENRMSELRRRAIEVLTDKRGELGIPKDKVEAIAEMILPDIIAFFQTDEGKKVFEEWKKEQEEKQKKEGGET